nr:hypothetical protein CFP56_49646 [Quercus suber]
MDDDEDNNAIPPYPVFIPPTNPKHTYFVKGTLFISLEQFKNAVTDYAVHGGWGIRFKKKNEKIQVRVVCQDGCKWIAYVAKMRDEMTFQMRTYYGRHTCTRTFKNMRCTSKWLGKKLVGELSDHPNMTSSTIIKGAQEKYVVHISRSKAHRAKPLQSIIPPHSATSAQTHSEGGANAQSTAIATATTSTNAENSQSDPLPRGKKLKKPRRKAIDTPVGKIKPWVSNVPLPEIWGPPPSWKRNSSITKETLMAASQTARYRETFNILGSQESVDAPPSFRRESENGKKGSRG